MHLLLCTEEVGEGGRGRKGRENRIVRRIDQSTSRVGDAVRPHLGPSRRRRAKRRRSKPHALGTVESTSLSFLRPLPPSHRSLPACPPSRTLPLSASRQQSASGAVVLGDSGRAGRQISIRPINIDAPVPATVASAAGVEGASDFIKARLLLSPTLRVNTFPRELYREREAKRCESRTCALPSGASPLPLRIQRTLGFNCWSRR